MKPSSALLLAEQYGLWNRFISATVASSIRWLTGWSPITILPKTSYRTLSFLYGDEQPLIPHNQVPHTAGSSLSCTIVPLTTYVACAAEPQCRKRLCKR